MNLKELVDTVLSDLDESLNDTALRAKVSSYVNRGYFELAKRENLEKTKTVKLINGKVKKPSDLVQLLDVQVKGYSINYELQGPYIKASSESDIDLVYIYKPEKLEANEDETITNTGNDEFIIHYAKWLFYLSEQEVNNANTEKYLYDNMELIVFNKYNSIKPVYDVNWI